MSLARAWTRQMFGASGAALLAPGTLIAALLVLAVSGSFAGIGALGQALAGPGAPAPSAGVPGAGGAPGPCTSCGSAPPPAPSPTLVDGLINAATGMTSRLPGALGPTTTQLLRKVNQTLGGVAPSAQSTLSRTLGSNQLLSGLHLKSQ